MAGWKGFEARLHFYEVEPVLAWRLAGVMTSSKESYDFLETLRARLRLEPRPVILDFENVEHITSAGVGIVAAAYTSATNAGVKLVLTALPAQVETVLNLVNFLSVIEHFGSEKEALARLHG
jgi:anti-sigma B factor antagonist